MTESDFAAEEAAWKEKLSQPHVDEELEGEPDQDEPPSDEPGQAAEPAGEPEQAAPPEKADEAPAPAADHGAQPAEPAAAAAPPTEPQPPSQAPTVEPFRPRADGVDIDAPGAFRANGFVAIPEATWSRVIAPRLVADRRALQQQAEERGKKAALADIDNHPRMARAKVFEATFEQLRQMPLEDAVNWAVAFKQDESILAAKAEANYWKAHAETHQTRESETREQQTAQELEQVKDQTLRGHIQNVLKDPQFAGLQLDANRIYDRLRYDRRTYDRADRDYPESGIKAGDEIVGRRFWDVIEQDANEARARSQQSVQAQGAAKRNAAALGQGKTKPVAPTVSTKGAHASADVSKVKKEPADLAEWQEMMLAKANE